MDPNLEKAIAAYVGLNHVKVDTGVANAAMLAANPKDPLVTMWLARCYHVGRMGFEKDTAKSAILASGVLAEIRALADKGSSEASFLLGSALVEGLGLSINPVEGAKWTRLAAENGHKLAQCNMASYSLTGQGVEKNDKEHAKWAQSAAAPGFSLGNAFLGLAHLNGTGVAVNYARAHDFLSSAYSQNHPVAAYGFGRMCERGLGVAQDEEKARKLYRWAAARGNTQAAEALRRMEVKTIDKQVKGLEQTLSDLEARTTPGRTFKRDLEYQSVTIEEVLPKAKGNGFAAMRERERQEADAGRAGAQFGVGAAQLTGDGGLTDIESGVNWMKKAAAQGHQGAMFILGLLHSSGKELDGLGSAFTSGVAQDLTVGTAWYKKSAEKGNLPAELNLGYAYALGLGVPRDTQRAVEWFRKAAAYHNKAQFNLALAYEKGEGVQKSLSDAVSWYRKAAGNDHAAARVNLGCLLMTGEGVQANPSEALSLFRKAAEQGNGLGEYNLGVAYWKGEGVPKDTTEAERRFRVAAEKGVRGGAAAAPDPGVTFSGELFAAIYSGRWTITKVEGEYLRDIQEFPEDQYPDREILSRRVKMGGDVASRLAQTPPTHVEYWQRNGAMLTYLIASSRIYGMETLNRAEALRYRVTNSGKSKIPTDDSETLYVDGSLAEMYKKLRLERHRGSALQDFSDHIDRKDLKDLEEFMRKWNSKSAPHRHLLENLTRFVKRNWPKAS